LQNEKYPGDACELENTLNMAAKWKIPWRWLRIGKYPEDGCKMKKYHRDACELENTLKMVAEWKIPWRWLQLENTLKMVVKWKIPWRWLRIGKYPEDGCKVKTPEDGCNKFPHDFRYPQFNTVMTRSPHEVTSYGWNVA
jgi:hypothetical protein